MPALIGSRRVIFSGGYVSPQAAAFLARTSGLDQKHRAAYIALINGLVKDGILPKLDLLQIYATQDQVTANLNMVSTSFGAAPSGAPTWAADVGYATAQNKFVDTGWAPSTAVRYTQNEGHVSVWSGTAAQTLYRAISLGTTNGGQVTLTTRNTSDVCALLINDNTAAATPANTDASGHFVGNRIDANTKQIFRNGVQINGDISRSSLALQAFNLYVGGSDATNGSRHNGISRGVSAGGKLTAAEIVNFHARLAAYMATIGATP